MCQKVLNRNSDRFRKEQKPKEKKDCLCRSQKLELMGEKAIESVD